MQEEINSSESELPVVCSLTRAEMGQRMVENNDFFQECAQTVELADGYAFRFDAVEVSLEKVLEFIRNERECCRFMRFELVFESQLGPLWLHLRGSQDAKDFVRANFVTAQV